MPAARIARWRALLRDTSLGVRVAAVLWVVWAFCVWNVVFDRVLVVAGRRYVYAAFVATRNADGYVLVDDWMRPAAARGFWTASAAAAAILAIGTAGLVAAGRRRAPTSPGPPQKN